MAERYNESGKNEPKKSGFATAGLVLGIIGICLSFIPIVNNLAAILGLIAVIFGIVAFFQKASKGKVIAVIILGALSILVTVKAQDQFSKDMNNAFNDFNTSVTQSLNEMNTSINKATGASTDDVLANDVEVTLGKFVATDSYSAKLPVTIKNKTNEAKSFSIQIEAVDENGNRISDDYAVVNNLGAGQSQEVKAFTLATSADIAKLKKAQFKIVEASTY